MPIKWLRAARQNLDDEATLTPPMHTPMAMPDYTAMQAEIVLLLDNARRSAGRTVNAVMTATYWEIGRRIVSFDQGGKTVQPTVRR